MPRRARFSLLAKFDPAAELSKVDVDLALSLAGVAEIERELVGRRAELADLHLSTSQVPLLVVLAVNVRIPAHDQRPVLLSRQEVESVCASGNARIPKHKVTFREECPGVVVGCPDLAGWGSFTVPCGNRDITGGHLTAIFKHAHGAFIGSGGLREGEGHGNEIQKERNYMERPHSSLHPGEGAEHHRKKNIQRKMYF